MIELVLIMNNPNCVSDDIFVLFIKDSIVCLPNK